jgi:hypothetical protein
MMEQPTNREILDALTASEHRTAVRFDAVERATRDILDALLDFKTATENEFVRVDARFTEVDERFTSLTDHMNRRFDKHDIRFGDVDRQLTDVKADIGELRREVRGKRKRD